MAREPSGEPRQIYQADRMISRNIICEHGRFRNQGAEEVRHEITLKYRDDDQLEALRTGVPNTSDPFAARRMTSQDFAEKARREIGLKFPALVEATFQLLPYMV